MDSHRFDNLTRALARATTRRGLPRGAAAGLLSGLAGRTAATSAQRPARRPNGQACSRSTDCASFICANGVCRGAACAGQCESCASGACQPVTGASIERSVRAACPGIEYEERSPEQCSGLRRVNAPSVLSS